MTANEQQSEAWNGAESAHYVDHADRYDLQLALFADKLLERAQLEPHHSVLDVGCRSGATTLAAARRARTALGVDLSEPLLEVAADRARSAAVENVEFVCWQGLDANEWLRKLGLAVRPWTSRPSSCSGPALPAGCSA